MIVHTVVEPSPASSGVLFPRVMLQRADLAAAAEAKAEALTWYTVLLELWEKADAEMQPTVTRRRLAAATLAK